MSIYTVAVIRSRASSAAAVIVPRAPVSAAAGAETYRPLVNVDSDATRAILTILCGNLDTGTHISAEPVCV